MVDRATNTIYAGNSNLPQIDVINGNTCKAGDLSGCAPVAEIPVGYAQGNFGDGAIDDATHTLYSADFFGNYISVINIAALHGHGYDGLLRAGAAAHGRAEPRARRCSTRRRAPCTRPTRARARRTRSR